MGKPKGSQKTGGRKKGSKNKNSIHLHDSLFQLEFNPAEELINLYKLSPPNIQAQILLKIVDFVFIKPTFQDQQHSCNVENSLSVQLNYKI